MTQKQRAELLNISRFAVIYWGKTKGEDIPSTVETRHKALNFLRSHQNRSSGVDAVAFTQAKQEYISRTIAELDAEAAPTTQPEPEEAATEEAAAQ